MCSVSLGSKGQDDVVVSSQNPWDLHADSCMSPTLSCVALVHAIYLEGALWDEGGTYVGPRARAWPRKLSP